MNFVLKFFMFLCLCFSSGQAIAGFGYSQKYKDGSFVKYKFQIKKGSCFLSKSGRVGKSTLKSKVVKVQKKQCGFYQGRLIKIMHELKYKKIGRNCKNKFQLFRGTKNVTTCSPVAVSRYSRFFRGIASLR